MSSAGGFVKAVSHRVHHMHKHGGLVILDAGDSDVASAAPPAFGYISALGSEARHYDIIYLARHTTESARELRSLQLRRALLLQYPVLLLRQVQDLWYFQVYLETL